MNKQELLDLHDALTGEAKALMEKKNADYSPGADPFNNFRLCNHVKICNEMAGVMVRFGDKYSRLATFVSGNEFQVKDESVKDTILDIINYAVILYGLSKEKQ